MTQPLTGRRVLVTRALGQSSALAEKLQAQGAEVLQVPSIEIVPPASWCALDAALSCVRSFDWVLFTSANGVDAWASRARRLALAGAPRRIAAIGPATARAVVASGIAPAVDLLPESSVAESLAEALAPHASQSSMLLVRAAAGRDVLPDRLRAAGAQVTVVDAYRTVVPADSAERLRGLFAAGGVDCVLFTSGSTAANFRALLGAAGVSLPPGLGLVSIGPVTSAAMREEGWVVDGEAAVATLDSLVSAVIGWCGR